MGRTTARASSRLARTTTPFSSSRNRGSTIASKVRSQSCLPAKRTRRNRACGWSSGVAPTRMAKGSAGRVEAARASSAVAAESRKATPRSTPSSNRPSGVPTAETWAPLPASASIHFAVSPLRPKIATLKRSDLCGEDIPRSLLLDGDLAGPAARARWRRRLHPLELPAAQEDETLQDLALERARLLSIEARLLEHLRDQAAGLTLRHRLLSPRRPRAAAAPRTSRPRACAKPGTAGAAGG